MTPMISGEELFLMIRNVKRLSSIPFIMILTTVSEEIKYRQPALGVNDFISKPFKIKELSYKITNVIDFKNKVIKQIIPDPFSKVAISWSGKPFLDSIDDILAKNMKKNFSHDEIASKLNINLSSLDKKIRKETELNVSQYVREFKLNYAVRLIQMGERNIQFISSEAGFNSLSYFSTSFKVYIKMTPRDYIKSLESSIKL